ncbi:major latex allergen Hev b 5-like [Pyrus ussuriensis x Pyrus communis]|uniref:Major latex allergen Hev b 5-like n=1 Tax=Pyrus ussuriensis x Pyrus communis TaxID=2448454 RepID=A0A5N5F2L5_9ROSA|nr:major latex allergen Hev b 5-like [Pyrus ussuriensis x Pyrus communis]
MVNFAHKANGYLKLSGVNSSSTVVQRGQGWLEFSPRMMGYKAQVVASGITLPICQKLENNGQSIVDFCRLSWPQTAIYRGQSRWFLDGWSELVLENGRSNWVMWCARVEMEGDENAEGNEESTKVTEPEKESTKVTEPEKQLETEKPLEEKTSDASANITIEDASVASETETKEITILSEEKVAEDVAETADQATKEVKVAAVEETK